MFYLDPVMVVKLAGFGGFLWLGLYIVSRAVQQTYLTIVSMLGMLAMAFFLFSSAMIGSNTAGLELEGGVLLAKSFWWANLLPTAFWFHMSYLIRRQVGLARKKTSLYWPVGLVYVSALILSLVGTFSDAFLDYTHSFFLQANHLFTDISPGYILIVIYLLLTTLASFYNLLNAWFNVRGQSLSRPTSLVLVRQLRLLVIGSFLFMLGAAWLSSNFYFKLNFNELWGNLFLLSGLILLGYGVAHFSLLVEGQDIQRDFIYSLTLNVVVCLVYVTALSLTGAYSSLNALVVVGLAVLSHTTFDFFRELWDKFFFNRPEQAARSEARAYATAIASQPTPVQELAEALEQGPLPAPAPDNLERTEMGLDGGMPSGQSRAELPEITKKKFDDLVRKAITDLKNPPQMIKSPLLSLATVDARLGESELEDNRLNRVAILREWLIQLIENLRPVGSETGGTGDAWRYYNVLYYPYVREISHKGALLELRRLQNERRLSSKREEPGEVERILEWLVDVDEDTFYKWQRRASDTIAAIIREQELKQRVVTAEFSLPIPTNPRI